MDYTIWVNEPTLPSDRKACSLLVVATRPVSASPSVPLTEPKSRDRARRRRKGLLNNFSINRQRQRHRRSLTRRQQSRLQNLLCVTADLRAAQPLNRQTLADPAEEIIGGIAQVVRQ